MFIHPFAKTYRDVLKEKYPDKAASLPDDFVPAAGEVQLDVMGEALKRYATDKELIIHTPFLVDHANTAPKEAVEYTFKYA